MVHNADPETGRSSLELPESFTQASLGTIDRLMDTALAGNPELLKVDLSRINTVDSAALNWLLATQTRLAGLSIQMILQNPSALITDVLVATRMENRFQLVCNARKTEEVNA
jgi:anti-anti-sigma regulatory factor